MSVKSCEKVEKSQVALTIEVGSAEFQAAIEKAYQKMRKKINVPGFRPGKAPRKIIEGMYGAEVFFEEAINIAFPEAYEAAVKEQELQVVGYPNVEMVGEVTKDGFTFKATAPVYPEVTLGEYKGLSAPKDEVKVTAADVDERLKQLSDRNTRLVSVEREAKEGDTAVIDFEGFLDGKPFDGGKGENHSLELGSHSFVPGFEEQVVGMKAGDEKDIELTFPEEYHAEELAGQPVVFKVKCVEVKEKQAPALDDEFAKDVSEFDTLAEFKEDLKSKIIDRNMQQSEAKFRQALLAQLCDQIDIELPAAMIETQIDRFVDNYAARLESQGISLETYMQYMQMDVQQIRDDLREPAVTQTKQQLALDAVVAAENIVISDEDVEAEVKKAAANLNMPYERIVEGLDREGLKKELARDKAMAVVAENAKANMITAEADNGEIKMTTVTKEEVEAEKEEKKAKKTRAKKTTEEGEAAPKKTTRKKKTEAEKAEAEKVEE